LFGSADQQIVDVAKGATTSHVKIDIGGDVVITSSITNEAVADLGLKKGDEAWAGHQGVGCDDRQITQTALVEFVQRPSVRARQHCV
jgi:molybdopterin-binding protein